MQILNSTRAAQVSGGAKPELVDERPIDHDRPIPIWHPIFVTDP